MNTEIAAYTPTKAALADLASRYKGLVFEVTTPKGMVEAKNAYKDINAHAITLEKARVAEKAASLAYSRFVDSEAKAIADELDALRLPIKDQIETETKREEREKAAAIEAEKQKILAEQAALKAAEERRMADERAELARQRAALDAEQKARDEIARQERLKLEQEQRYARAKIEAEERTARLAREEADRAAKAVRDAEEAKAKQLRDAEDARLKAERDALDAKRREVEAAERKEREAAEAKAKAIRDAEEAEQRKIKQAAAEKADMRQMLETFRSRFGHLNEVADVVAAIDAFLAYDKIPERV